MLELGADPSEKEYHSWDALFCTTWSGDIEKVKVLIEAGVDVCSDNGGGRSPLHMAIQDSSDSIARILLQNGANPNQIYSQLDVTPTLSNSFEATALT